MKKLLSTTLLMFSLLMLSHSVSYAQEHGTKLGVGVLYGSEVETAGIQGNATFRVSPKVAIAPDISIYFPDDDDTPGYIDSFWALNLNGHFMLDTDPDYHIYALGGLNVSTIEYEGTDDSESELGLNLGLGSEYHLNNFSLFGELKYVVSDFDQVVLGVGARFPLY